MKLNNNNPYAVFGMHPIQMTESQKEYFENMRGMYFDIVTYLPLHYVLSLLNSRSTMCDKYILIEHNNINDLIDNETGNIKKEHIHIVFCAVARRRASRLCKLFNTTEILRLANNNELLGSVKYLTHETENAIKQGKVKYEKSKLISNDLDFFNHLAPKLHTCDNSLEIIDCINMGYPFREMVAMFGRDFVYRYKQYKEMADIIKEEYKPFKFNNNNEVIDNE